MHVTYLFVCELDLIGDEAYYWDWSRNLDWCYYSKPPMVAWLIAWATAIGGDYSAVVRLPAVLLGAVFLGYFYATARVFYSSQAAAFALLLMLAMPFNVLANLIMTIDPPLYCFWMMSLYYLHRALFLGQQRAWFWAGVSTGAALLSKQVAIFIPLMLVFFLLLDKQRYGLFRREFIVFLLPIILCSLPIFLWNQQHDWVMFDHSKAHFDIVEPTTLLTRFEQGLTFLLYQLLLATPVIAVLLVILSVKACIGYAYLPEKEKFLVLMGPVFLLGIIALSFFQKTQGNWPVPFYFTALIMLSGQWQAGNWKKTLEAGLCVGYFMVLVTYALPLLIQVFNWHNTPLDPTFRFRHTQDLVLAINAERQKVVTHPERTFVLVLGHRYLISELAFYLPDHPQIYRYVDNGKITSQYEVWPGPTDALGKAAFIVTDKEEAEMPAALKSVFLTFHKVGVVANPWIKNAHYNLFLGESLKYWPPLRK